MRFLALLTLCLAAQMAAAQTADIRPEARPGSAQEPVRPALRPAPAPPGADTPQGSVTQPADAAVAAPLRPVARPQDRPALSISAPTLPQSRADALVVAQSPLAVRQSPRPTVRPAAITQRAVEQEVARVRGQVCGDPAIQGQTIGTIAGNGSCGVENAVRVRSVAGVTLTPNPTIDCRTASALKAWVAQTAKPAVGQTGGGISSLRIVAHYACRNRNNASTGRLSEHAFGRAVDIGGIGLKSGRELTVLTDWNRGEAGDILKTMWRGACGPFGTVLGPNANAAHRDHFHFDTARYRSGSYCR